MPESVRARGPAGPSRRRRTRSARSSATRACRSRASHLICATSAVSQAGRRTSCRPEQPLLLGTENQMNRTRFARVSCRPWPCCLRDLEIGRRAGAVVVDARPGRDRVEVRTDDHRLVRVALGRVGDHVVGGARLAQRVSRDAHRHRAALGKVVAAPCRCRTTSRPPGCRSDRRACPDSTSVRPGWPSLKMITATGTGCLGVRRPSHRTCTCRAGSARRCPPSRPG